MSAYLDDESRAHFDRVQALLDGRRRAVHAESAARARARLLLAHRVRVASRTGSERRAPSARAGATTGSWRSSAVETRRPSAGRSASSASSSCSRREGIGAAETPPDAHLVAAGDAERRFGFKLAEQLRERLPGLKLSIGGPAAGFKAQLRRADKSGARYALIVGEAELQAGKVSFKPLREDQPQQLVTVDECIDLLRQTRTSA